MLLQISEVMFTLIQMYPYRRYVLPTICHIIATAVMLLKAFATQKVFRPQRLVFSVECSRRLKQIDMLKI